MCSPKLLSGRSVLIAKLHTAKAFYGILCDATLLGVVPSFTAINPIKAPFWSAVNNGQHSPLADHVHAADQVEEVNVSC
jgi:hypothetical protein